MRTRTDHPLLGKVVRWAHGPNVLVGPATVYDTSDDELFIVPDGLMHGHYWVPASECTEATDTFEPTEAQVLAALNFYWAVNDYAEPNWSQDERDDMRLALSHAFATGHGGCRE